MKGFVKYIVAQGQKQTLKDKLEELQTKEDKQYTQYLSARLDSLMSMNVSDCLMHIPNPQLDNLRSIVNLVRLSDEVYLDSDLCLTLAEVLGLD